MIGFRIREERDMLKLSQTAFAELIGVDKTTVINWEKDRSSPTTAQLAALSAKGVDGLYILTGIRQGMMAAGKPLSIRQANLLNSLEHATDSDWAAINHMASLIEQARGKPTPEQTAV